MLMAKAATSFLDKTKNSSNPKTKKEISLKKELTILLIKHT